MTPFRWLLAMAILAVCGPLSAHDFWIQPSAFDAAVGAPIALRLMVGEDFTGESLAPPARSIIRFDAHDDLGRRPVTGLSGVDPAGLISGRRQGLLTVSYQSRPSFIELAAEPFEHYLREEGLEHVIAMRVRRGESAAPGRELFSRSAKSLITIEDGGEATAGAPALGLALEFLSAHAETPVAGAPVELELLFRGQPVADVLVVAMPKADPSSSQRLRTDSEGRVRVDLTLPGPWLVKAVHMLPTPPSTAAQWESWWASLTLSIPAS
ncbi:MAG: DUF4198 domain-containing protein [Acidobacteria bacterium]|nr:DUF4198 domain-containing protein [Acidobacteriota bacterium]